MNKKRVVFSMVSGLLFVNSVMASEPEPKTDKDRFDINSIEYIEEESDFKLGFDTADYLPDGFDPNKFYFDVNNIVYIDEMEEVDLNTEKYLPEGFNAYAYPSDVQSINYIDLNDEIDFDIDIKHTPQGVDAYAK